MADRDEIRFGNLCLTVIHTPGHTPGSVCFLCRTRIIPLDKKTIIHPGHHHGQEFESTLDREMKENIYITDFILNP